MDAALPGLIAHSYAIYARACDEKRYDLLAQVFAPEARLRYHVAGHEFSCTGAEAAARFSAFLERCWWTHHLIAAPMVERVAGGISASARVTATHLQHRADGSANRWLVRGSYHDSFEQRDGHWLIVARDCHCLDAEGEFEAEGVLLYPALAWTDPALLR